MPAGLLHKGQLALCLAIFLALISGSVAENCPVGQQDDNDDSCEDCPVGYYSDQTDGTLCTKCTGGKTTLATASTQASDCIRNCPVGQQPNSGDTACEDCPKGKYSDQTDNTACTACTDGKTTAGTGSTQASDCIGTCPVGQQPNSCDTACEDCPKGKYSDQTDNTACTPCTDGKTTAGTGSTQASDCIEKSLAVQTRPGVALYFCFLLVSFFLFA